MRDEPDECLDDDEDRADGDQPTSRPRRISHAASATETIVDATIAGREPDSRQTA